MIKDKTTWRRARYYFLKERAQYYYFIFFVTNNIIITIFIIIRKKTGTHSFYLLGDRWKERTNSPQIIQFKIFFCVLVDQENQSNKCPNENESRSQVGTTFLPLLLILSSSLSSLFFYSLILLLKLMINTNITLLIILRLFWRKFEFTSPMLQNQMFTLSIDTSLELINMWLSFFVVVGICD